MVSNAELSSSAFQRGGFAIPAFADSTRLRLLLGTLLYLAQGFPQGIFFYALPAWLVANDQSTEVVAMAVAAASLPWSLKFLAGLLMDRVSWLPMGRRRPWLVGSQTGIFATLIAVAIIDPLPTQTAMIIAVILTLSILTAVQDVALDALVVDLTPDEEMGRMNGFMFAGKVFGIAGGMAITSYLLEHYGLATAMIGMAVFFVIPAGAAVVIRERKGEKLLPWTRGGRSADLVIKADNWFEILSATLRNLFKPQSLVVVLVLLTYGIHQNLNDTTNSLFAIRQLGWTQSEFANLGAISNIGMGVFCFLIGGRIVDRFGPKRVAFWCGIVAFPAMGWYLIDPALWEDSRLYILWYVLNGIPLFLFYLANLVLAMRVTAQEVAATSFAAFMAFPTLGFTIASAILPILEDIGGYQAMFGASAALVLLAGLFTVFLKEKPTLFEDMQRA
ncbi:MAG: MFS transporter [Pseudomonadota bacterium]